jgi:hypothetical protein
LCAEKPEKMQRQPVPAAADSDPNRLVSSEEEMLRLAPLPYERVVYWGSGSPQGELMRRLLTLR